MADKERGPMFDVLAPEVDVWITIPVPSSRALPSTALALELGERPGAMVVSETTPGAGMRVAAEHAGSQGRIVVFGSFLTVQAVLERLPATPGISPSVR